MNTASTDKQYYENEEHWGENQFITLQNIIDNILITASNDSYFKHSKYFQASIFGKQCLKKLAIDIRPEHKAISIQVPANKTFPHPRYMTNWVRVSVLNECEKLTVLNVKTLPTIQDYLQDNDGELLYDESGEVLRADDFNAEIGHCKLKFACKDSCNKCEDTKFKDSWVKDVRDAAYFEFSDDLVDEIIVIEFISAGLMELKDCDIKIPHALELTVENWIRWCLLKSQRNVPMADVNYYWQLYKMEKRRSKSILSDKLTIEQIIKSVGLRYKT
jgi:hypothetical protein